MSFAIGCLLRKGTIAEDDGEAVKELKKAGGIPIAVTNTPEYGMSWETNNLVTGCTRNPYNFYRSAGGSSGGEVSCNLVAFNNYLEELLETVKNIRKTS